MPNIVGIFKFDLLTSVVSNEMTLFDCIILLVKSKNSYSSMSSMKKNVYYLVTCLSNITQRYLCRKTPIGTLTFCL